MVNLRRAAPIAFVAMASLTLAGAIPGALAYPPYLIAWQTKYPTSTLPSEMASLTGSSCHTCHHPPQRHYPGTCYRETLKSFVEMGMEIEDALELADPMDSDGDRVPNGVEILMQRSDDPTQIGYHPGLVGSLGTDPCYDFPEEVVTGRSETPAAACPADLNGDGFVDFADYLEFLNLYEAQDPRVDFNGDGFVDFLDYLEFLNLYEAGC